MFGGIQKNSFIDYPDKISCVLFLTGCNFRCPYCHNPQLTTHEAIPPDFLTSEWVSAFLKDRKGFLDGVVISGGEPTIAPRMVSLCNQIKSLGYPIKIDTNGSRPEVLKRLIADGLVDYIAMDIKTLPEAYYPLISKTNHPERIHSSIRLIIDSGVDHEFRTTCVAPFITAENIQAIGALIKGAARFVLQPFQDTDILNPDFFKDRGEKYTEETLERFRSLVEPFVKNCIIRGSN